MKRQYLGDSYDAVKRLWQEILAEWAPLHAEPEYIPDDIRSEFTAFTRIPLLTEHRPPFYSILNDPDTGIRVPNRANQSEGASHINLATICGQLKNTAVGCVITFDQSHHRERGFAPKDQRKTKVQWLQRERLHAFYYVSHAPFLFAFSKPTHMDAVLALLRRAGLPSRRIEVPE